MRNAKFLGAGISVCSALVACSDSRQIAQIQSACDSGGKFSKEVCRCIAEGAADAEMPELISEWLATQLEAEEGTPTSNGVSPKMKTRDFLRFMGRVQDPERLCES